MRHNKYSFLFFENFNSTLTYKFEQRESHIKRAVEIPHEYFK